MILVNKEKAMAEMNNQELFAVLAGYGSSKAQYELKYVLAKASNYANTTTDTTHVPQNEVSQSEVSQNV